MPKIITPTMRAHLDEETTKLAAIWRITRKDGAQFFFTDHRIFTVSEDLSGFADGWFDEGAVTFETGANAGRTIEVKSWTQGTRRLELWAPTGLPVEVGDQLRIYPGCHKRVLEDCRDRFRIPGSILFDRGNVRNFRGEPYVPGSPLTAVQAGRG